VYGLSSSFKINTDAVVFHDKGCGLGVVIGKDQGPVLLSASKYTTTRMATLQRPWQALYGLQLNRK